MNMEPETWQNNLIKHFHFVQDLFAGKSKLKFSITRWNHSYSLYVISRRHFTLHIVFSELDEKWSLFYEAISFCICTILHTWRQWMVYDIAQYSRVSYHTHIEMVAMHAHVNTHKFETRIVWCTLHRKLLLL